MDPCSDPVAPREKTERSEVTNRFAISKLDLERATRVPLDEQVVEVPSSARSGALGDDDFTRALRGLINPGV
jgi:hypothetical protein